jgi:trehalose 6-phosphate synthase/phosphatase
MAASKLIVVSARLPVSLQRANDEWTATPSPGGLATALRSVADRRPFTWIGWPGTHVATRDHEAVREALAADDGSVPVFIGKREFAGFYEHFSNRLLWPLFHSLPDRANYDRASWRQYCAVNERFADAVRERAEPGDTVWVHDYQLALVPQLLRDRGLDCAIGFFLHIPFPSAETYRTLPVREEVLRGMLGANLLGFHTYEYVSHFRSSCLRILGLESEPETIFMPSHAARLGVMPIGIEPQEIERLAETGAAAQELATLQRRFAGKRVIVGVDRLDYTKGIPQKLLAFEELLRNNPRLRDRVVLIQVASPSRTGVAEYQSLKREVDELVGRINGNYGTMGHTPIVYINQNVSRERLTALYRIADIAFITPVRDGMNLVCLEYIAARGDVPGTLVLSEFAGAAACLSGARLVNPHNPVHMAEVLADALATGPSAAAFEHMVDFVHMNTSSVWAQRFLARLENLYEEMHTGVQRLDIAKLERGAVSRGGKRPLVLLDYDGTLQPHATVPSDASPSQRVLDLLTLLGELATVYVVSGRPAGVLDDWLGALPIGLVCEHGLNSKRPGAPWPEQPPIDRGVLEEVVRPVLRDFVERTPGSKIETKHASLAWHYRAADPKFGAWRAKELYALLDERLRGEEFSVLAGSRVVEVRHRDVSKGRAAERLLASHREANFVVCAGNDRTDEEMFEALVRSGTERVLICHVGGRNTIAQYFVETPVELLGQLELLQRIWREEQARQRA